MKGLTMAKKHKREVKTKRIIAQDGPGRRKLEGFLKSGWRIESSTQRQFFRGATYVFVRDTPGTDCPNACAICQHNFN